jgi:regulatory protein
MAMTGRRHRKPRPPLDAAKLDELALGYVGRFATSRSKLLSYLNRKLRERGWNGDGEPPLDGLVERLTRLGYVDDRAYAVSKARSLTSRGYGEKRVAQALTMAGIDGEDRGDATDLAEAEAVDAALKFARRRSIGPFASSRPDPSQREKLLAAMIRAGHRFSIAKAIIDLNPGEEPDREILANLR